ncbi:MAG: hypothetical protein EXR72_11020 [Myxococcales bacterium]|nr:hypothetical protein [Myxococcales bacterium]
MNEKKKQAFAFGYAAVPLMVILPPLVYYMWICMEYYGGAMVMPTLEVWRHIPLPTVTSVAIWMGWFGFQAALQIYAPGPWIEGAALVDGSRLKYKMNGWFTWWFTWVCIAAGVYLGWFKPTVLFDHFGPLMTTVHLFAFGLSAWMYLLGKMRPDDGTAELTGNLFHEYFMGTALNPRTGNFDWKLFCEARPGLIGWVAINLSFAAQQYQVHGSLTTPMILVCAFHFFYVADYYFHEEAILSTWDIRHENFGWMLVWGDLAWVPFTYTLQALYLIQHTHDLSLAATVGIVALNVAGYLIFRITNIQKHNFRKNPEALIWGKKPEFIKTQKGSVLLLSGMWGIARHLNYLGDLMMALAWCLVCGFGNLLPYFYIIYFTILLVHRERRDHVTCAAKYGKDWEDYCAKVRWRIVPGVY